MTLVRRRRLVLMLCLLAGIGGGVFHSVTSPKLYAASSRSVISIPAGREIQDALAGAQLTRTLIGTYTQVATSRQVAQRVATSIGLPGAAGTIRGRLTAVAVPNTLLIDITAVDPDPVQAATVADAAALALGAQVAVFEAGKSQPVESQILDRASVPTGPVTPQPRRDAVVGIILGLLAGVAAVIALEALDRSIKLPAQGATTFGAPLLGVVPRRRNGLGLICATEPHSVEAEAVRAIRTSLRFLEPDHPLRVLLVTSPTPSDGKTTIASNLAISIASGGDKVLLVDGDLRRAGLTERFGLERAVGVSTLLVRASELDESIVSWGERLDVLPAGVCPPNVAELLGSESMVGLLDDLVKRYHLIIIDGPPVLPVTDPVVLSALVDGVITVARYGKTSRTAAVEATRRLESVGGRILGYVLNGIPPSESQDYYASYGINALRPTPRRPEPTADIGTTEALGPQ
ncbi:polysaccharide biosynthesis tyrosine autokinase [Aeromicrobium sp.]|uniref:polysaccharide biosynthesis tyrosine autokinase n=1 Tax=Aeromicrobium sp. TaxID=1871063 RepID=UPI0019978B34|nr:polysaccharide biosynthesis tyrosine autokinase [Aeromicrobium sp.]MBC7630451.1 polysaccharide biosynthesis tyrosine autokinase [Aeromicrobium sp.]